MQTGDNTIGNAPPAAGWTARPMVMIVDGPRDPGPGTALARDLVLTAAHCAAANAHYDVKVFQQEESSKA